MPTRKQRRRRQKERRHDYEYVYVDDEGHEVAVEEAGPESTPRRREARTDNGKGKASKARSSRQIRKVDPPSWSRVMRRALIFAPLIFFALQILNHTYTAAGRLALTAVYTAFFIPFMYLMDRAMYRNYQRRIGNPPPARGGWRR